MAYEPDASNILGPMQAAQMGASAGENLVSGFQAGQGIAEQLRKAQAQRLELEKSQQEHKNQMINHAGETMFDLASAPDEEVNGPLWKAKFNYLADGFSKMGVDIDSDSLKESLRDPSYRKQLSTSFAKLQSLDPAQRAQALQDNANMLGGITGVAKLSEGLDNSYAKLLSSGGKQSKDIESRASKLREGVKGINQKIDTSQSFAKEASSILDKWDSFSTGQAETALKDAYNKALSGGAPRSFTLAMMDSNRSIGAKLDGLFSKLETGKKLTTPERNDMRKALGIMETDADEKRYSQLSPYYNATKALSESAKANNVSLNPNEIIPEEHWNKLSDKESNYSFNPETGKFESKETPPPKSEAKLKRQKLQEQQAPADLSMYSSEDQGIIKHLASKNFPIDTVNEKLKQLGQPEIPQEVYNQLRRKQRKHK